MKEALTGFQNNRFRPVDAARGTAMLFVFLAHFGEVTITYCSIPVTMLYAVTMIASPAFIAISGTIMGILYCVRGDRFRRSRSRFFWRGVFLLTAGRLLIMIAHIPHAGGWDAALRWAFMTDAIAVCLLLGPVLMDALRPARRALLGAALFLFSWTSILIWQPDGLFHQILKEFFFGSFQASDRFFTDVFPVFPWLGLYLLATALGELMGRHLVAGHRNRVMHISLRAGLAALAATVFLFGSRYYIENLAGVSSSALHMILSPLLKLPPGPVYALFYTGALFLILWGLQKFERFRPVKIYAAFAELFGRHSLFVFIVQYFVYFGLFPFLPPAPRVLWPVLFVLSVFVLWVITRVWERGRTERSFATAS